jgi:hypothetical protein
MLSPEDDDEEMEEAAKDIDILRYQDPIGDMQSGLHAAITESRQEVAWLLLLTASKLDTAEMPAEVLAEAEQIGIARSEGDLEDKMDIRLLKDANGRTAEDLAKETGGVWSNWVAKGWLKP